MKNRIKSEADYNYNGKDERQNKRNRIIQNWYFERNMKQTKNIHRLLILN